MYMGGGGGGDATAHMTSIGPCGCNIVNIIQYHSMSLPFTVINHRDKNVLLAAATIIVTIAASATIAATVTS